MFSHLHTRHFKAFEELSLEIRPITIFLGPNNSGKSSILAAFRLLSQTVKSYDPQVSLLLNGEQGDFGTYKDVVHENNKARQFSLDFTITLEEGFTRPSQFALSAGTRIQMELTYMYRKLRREVILRNTALSVGDKSVLTTKHSAETGRQTIESVGGADLPSALKSSISSNLRMRNFVPDHLFFGSRYGTREPIVGFDSQFLERSSRLISRAGFSLVRHFTGIEYVGAMRQPPSRTYSYTGENRTSVGSSGQHAASILVMDSGRSGSKSKQILHEVRGWLKQASIASDIKIDTISDRHFEIRIQHPETLEFQNYADVGYGNSQVIPILVAGYNLSPGAVLMVEEPEIHLHPRAQSELGDFFLAMYKRNIQSLVETHSEHLVLRMQQHVVEGFVSPKDLIFYYVHAEKGNKVVVPLTLDTAGRFEGEWPRGFFRERLHEATRLAKLRQNVVGRDTSSN